MSVRRENSFPATSIGRTSGVKLQASSGVDAHPLLSPRPPSPALSEQGSITEGGPLNSGSAPRYRPYTPRQRITPTAATTGTTVHPPSPSHLAGDATSKLQVMHLKAAAQMIGLDSGTLGWAILETLVQDVDSSEGWVDVWNALTTGKATLLLPLESAFTNEKISPELLKDHVIFCDKPSRSKAPIVTLSGLRGTLDEETLTFRSTIHPSAKHFQGLLHPATRASTLSTLPSLPPTLPSNSPIPYPSFHVPAHTSSLYLPRTPATLKPPLPARPGARANQAGSTSTARISNPFASLFGGPKQAPQPVPASPPASLHSIESTHETPATIEMSAFAINRRIVMKDVGKDINKAIKTELKLSLKGAAARGEASIPYWTTERVLDFAVDWYPFVKSPGTPVKAKFGGDRSPRDSGRPTFVVNSLEENPDDMADRMQEFFQALEEDMRVSGTPFTTARKESGSEIADEKEIRKGTERQEDQLKIQEVMEVVERSINWLFYDRLFKQPTTDDISHDEALANRIAALNMLDLGLGHLGIDIGDVNESDLDAVVKACGEMLSQLDSCWCPADKATMLVAAHKIVVDGLSRLPPIKLSEESANGKVVNEVPSEKSARLKADFVSPADTLTTPITHPDETTTLSVLFSPVNDHEPTRTEESKEDVVPSVSLATAEKLASSDLEAYPPSDPTPVSGDVLLPLIIFSVVKSNPPHLVSHLLYTQRFRNRSVGGEESYCLINLMAVAEFLENVDMAALGLGDSDKVISTADLTPIPLARSPVTADTALAPVDGTQSGLRGRVEQGVDAIADSANKVITGVVDSSFGILRSFMPTNTATSPTSGTASGTTPSSTLGRAGFGLLRRESGFSIANLAASLPITGRSKSGANAEESGQQLVSVSRPSSIRSRSRSRSRTSLKIKVGDGQLSGESSTEDEGEESSSEESDSGEESDEVQKLETGQTADAKSIRSFENMLSASKSRRKDSTLDSKQRKTLSDRLASVSALAATSTSPTGSRRSSLHVPPGRVKSPSSPTTSRPTSPALPLQARFGPPKQRFIECTPDDLRLSEVGELLRDYRRLVEEIRAVNGFDE
ncbi:hypothetical protein CPB83DRAFT_817737 [Crepidotus variabilis]|uniref:VPS9 domain-containing protein n=1 Tax=Crepidotus variabilis TaxID=179855 RepID=A0A9P6EBI2_9AGAR|nr:hypothetical protein CPB83DRAFT_817737 [Crepidotus variabilis]